MTGKINNEKSNQAIKLGAKIKTLRTKLNIKQDELAERAGINRSYLSMLENGKSSPTVDVLERLAQALHISLSELTSYDTKTITSSPDHMALTDSSTGFDLGEKHFKYDTEEEYDIYPGLREFLEDQDEMMLAQPQPEEIRLLKGIRFSGNFRPDKRFYRDALLSYRRSRKSSS